MTKINGLNALKRKWNVPSLWAVISILVTFTLAGSTVVYLKKYLFLLLSFDDDTSLVAKVIVYLIFVFPAYQLLLIVYGTMMGQFRCFWEKEKRLFDFIKSNLTRLC